MEKIGLFDIIDKFNSAASGNACVYETARRTCRRRSAARAEKTRQKEKERTTRATAESGRITIRRHASPYIVKTQNEFSALHIYKILFFVI